MKDFSPCLSRFPSCLKVLSFLRQNCGFSLTEELTRRGFSYLAFGLFTLLVAGCLLCGLSCHFLFFFEGVRFWAYGYTSVRSMGHQERWILSLSCYTLPPVLTSQGMMPGGWSPEALVWPSAGRVALCLVTLTLGVTWGSHHARPGKHHHSIPAAIHRLPASLRAGHGGYLVLISFFVGCHFFDSLFYLCG